MTVLNIALNFLSELFSDSDENFVLFYFPPNFRTPAESLVYVYKNVVTGFAARLTVKEAEKLASMYKIKLLMSHSHMLNSIKIFILYAYY